MMKFMDSDNLILGGIELILTNNEYKNEYNFIRQYEIQQQLTNGEVFAVVDDIACNHGTLSAMHLFYFDLNDTEHTEQINRYYESIEAFHKDVIPDTYHCIRFWMDIAIEDKVIDFSLFNHMLEKGKKQKAHFMIGCCDKSCGGTICTDVYYLYEGKPVKRDTNGDSFFAWDEDKHEWVRSHCLWCDFFGWDGWGDGIGVFKKIEKEEAERLINLHNP